MNDRKRVLIIIPYKEIHPPVNGGMKRCFHLLHQLAVHFDVTAIVQQDIASLSEASVRYPEINAVQFFRMESDVTPASNSLIVKWYKRLLSAVRYRVWKRTLKGPTDELFIGYYRKLSTLMNCEKFDFVVLENLTTLNAVSVIRRYDKDVPIIYDAHNFDTHLAGLEYRNGTCSENQYRLIRDAEAGLHRLVQLVWTCSDVDKQAFEAANFNKVECVTIPNGAEFIELHHTKAGVVGCRLIFCGSLSYLPNCDGLKWFITNCWSRLVEQFPDIELMIVGSGKPDISMKEYLDAKNVRFYGRVEEVSDYYRKARISIIPLLSGSGTRLKLLESFSFKTAVVSTSIGAEGVNYADTESILIADTPDEFVKAVESLLADDAMCNRIAEAGYSMAKETYDWNVIGDRLVRSLKNIYHFV